MNFCTSCGKKTLPQNKFCTSCGADISSIDENESRVVRPARSNPTIEIASENLPIKEEDSGTPQSEIPNVDQPFISDLGIKAIQNDLSSKPKKKSRILTIFTVLALGALLLFSNQILGSCSVNQGSVSYTKGFDFGSTVNTSTFGGDAIGLIVMTEFDMQSDSGRKQFCSKTGWLTVKPFENLPESGKADFVDGCTRGLAPRYN
jgi:hypothetical protein